MVSSLEETYLSSTDLSTLRTHFIASLKNVWYDNYLFRVLPSLSPNNSTTTPAQNLHCVPIHFKKGQKYSKAPSQNFYQEGHGVIFLKNDERKRRREYP